MGGAPEQFKEEPMKDAEGTPERSILPEFYDKAKWEGLKQGDAYFSIYNKGKAMGVPQQELDKFAQDAIAQEIKNQNYGFVARFMESMGIGTREEVAEWKHASEEKEAEQKRAQREGDVEGEERELNVSIAKGATFADLFDAIDIIEKEQGLGELHLEEELWNNFDSEIAERVLAFRDAQASKAATTKVLDFFKKCGYSQSEVSAFLPIKFRRERKKK